jgi:hypothetical protein
MSHFTKNDSAFSVSYHLYSKYTWLRQVLFEIINSSKFSEFSNGVGQFALKTFSGKKRY